LHGVDLPSKLKLKLFQLQGCEMPFIALILAAIAGGAVWWWRMKTLGEASHEVIDSAQDMDEVLVFADWVSGKIIDPADPVRRFRDLWRDTLTIEERSELISIADEVATIVGKPTAPQENALQSLRRALLN